MEEKQTSSPPLHRQLAERAAQYRDRQANSKAARMYRLAGDYATKLNANRTAIDYYNMALAVTAETNLNQWYALILAREFLFDRLGTRDKQQQDLINLAMLADVLDDDEKRAEAAVRQANYRLNTGDYEDTLMVVRLGVRMAQFSGCQDVEAAGRLVWGKTLLRQGDYDGAQIQLRQALTLVADSEHTALIADAHRALGVLLLDREPLAEAMDHFLLALPIYRRLEDRFSEGRTLSNLGTGAYRQRQWDEARRFWEEALPIHEIVEDPSGKSMLLNNLGSLAMDVADYETAQTHFELARTTAGDIYQRFGECVSLLNLGLVHHYTGQLDEAREYGQQALSLAHKLGSRPLQANGWTTLGQIREAQGAWDSAEAAYWEALGIWQEAARPTSMLEQEAGLARVALAQGQTAVARTHCDSIVQHLADGGDFTGIDNPGLVYLTLYRVLTAAEDPQAADVIRQAYYYLQEKAATIDDDTLRTAFMQQVAVHRDIVAAYDALQATE